MPCWEHPWSVLAAEQPRKLQLGVFQETAQGLAILPDERAPFVPQLNMEGVEMQRRLMKHRPSVSFALPPPVYGRSPVFAALLPSPSLDAPVQAPMDDYIPCGRPRRVESELIRFEASIRRLEHGDRSILSRTPSSLESGELLDAQHVSRSLKRERDLSPQPPIKRPRHGDRPDLVSYRPNANKIFYGGPDLMSIDPRLQEQYTPIRPLGTGGQGTAYLLRSRRTESLVACKVIPHPRSENKDESELFFLRDALPPHSRIIGLRSALVTPSHTQLYLDYCSGGDLTSFIEAYESKPQSRGPRQIRNYIPEPFIWHTFLQLTEALAFIHHGYNCNAPSSRQKTPDKWLSVIHRDIKPSNIFLQRAPWHPDHPGPEPYPKIVLGDFGLAKQADDFTKLPTSDSWMGTFIFQAPELPHHSTKGDVWSVGAIIFLMMTGYLPTENLPETIDNPRVVRDLWWRALVEEKANSPPGHGIQGYSKGLEWCLERALTENPKRRMDSLQLFLAIEDSRARVAAGWDELIPWMEG
ncbi:hypothetical protein XPA_005272 [Xanthoria parietina]